jgi:hypothetical protein
MQMQGQALAGKTGVVATKRGEQQKSQLKVMDIGPEAAGGDVYWVDFWGEDALLEEELEAVLRRQVEIEVRHVSASAGKRLPQTEAPGGAGGGGGRVFLNFAGGAVKLNGQVVQRALRTRGSHQTAAAQRSA